MAIKPIRVSQLNGYIKRILQSDPILGNVSVIGEISNLKHHSTGHIYFTMKDADSKLNCFLPADQVRRLRYELADGMEITAFGYIYLYERGGSYSLNIRDLEVEGVGNLSAAFEKLRGKLEEEGLFSEKYKKPLPYLPRKIVVITSPTGAAVRDIIKIITSRSDITNIIVYPVLVQGPEAAGEIARAINEVNRLFPETDLIIAGRGGGSLEELWAFNEEVVARSIFLSEIPVISAVGHETDFTIADFTADKRAATPTEAAQLAVPDVFALRDYVESTNRRLHQAMESKLKYMELVISGLGKDLFYAYKDGIARREAALSQAMTALESGDPIKILARGYGLVTDEEGRVVTAAEGLHPGDPLTIILKDGKVNCTVNFVCESDRRG